MKPWDIVSEILKAMAAMAKPGVTTLEINDMAEQMIRDYKVVACNKGYQPTWAKIPFPTATTININFIIAHGIPTEYKLMEGDVVSLDLGIKKDGQCADAALTVGVGEISNKARHLLKYAKRIMDDGIEAMGPGVSTRKIAEVISQSTARYGYKVNRRFAGHTIGTEMHMKPNIFNSVEKVHEGKYADLVPGQIVCIEPMITLGSDDLGIVTSNSWETITNDARISVFFEHMVLITETGHEVLTNHIE